MSPDPSREISNPNTQIIRRRSRSQNGLTTKTRRHKDTEGSSRVFVLLRGLAHWTSAATGGAGRPGPVVARASRVYYRARRAFREELRTNAFARSSSRTRRPMSSLAPFVSWCLRGEKSPRKNNFFKDRGSTTLISLIPLRGMPIDLMGNQWFARNPHEVRMPVFAQAKTRHTPHARRHTGGAGREVRGSPGVFGERPSAEPQAALRLPHCADSSSGPGIPLGETRD